MVSEQIKIKYLRPVKPIEIKEKGDWHDLRAAKRVVLETGQYALVPLGVAMQLPEGYEAHVCPRSSTFKTWKIIQANTMGIIDNSYCGDNDEWHMPVYATEHTEINVNDRICQFRIVKKQPPIVFIEVDHLDNPDRGGIGSTGKN